MSGILRLESLTKGNTLRQGDLTLLKYRLFDADGDKLDISGKSATVRLMKNDFTFIAYEKEGLTIAPDDTISFSVNKVLPGGLYHLEVIVDNQYIFPSRDDEGKLNIDKSSLGADVTIVEATGVEAVARKATGMMKQDEEFIDDMIENVISDTNVGNIEEYYNQFNEATNEFESLKTQALNSVTKSDKAIVDSASAKSIAQGIDAKATNALSLSESADTLSKSVQEQFNQVVIDGDSSVESAQARVDASGQTNATLKERLDKEHNEVTAQLAQASIHITDFVNVKELGVTGDGVADDTINLQNIFDTYNNIYIPTGTYYFTRLKITKSNMIINFGEGVTLKSDFALGDTIKGYIHIEGSLTDVSYPVLADIPKLSKKITLSPSTVGNFQEDDIVELSQDKALQGDSEVTTEEEHRQQHAYAVLTVKYVDTITGEIEFHERVPYEFKNIYNIRATKVNAVKNVSIIGSNTSYDKMGVLQHGNFIEVTYGHNINISGFHFYNGAGKPIEVFSTNRFHISDIKFSDPVSYSNIRGEGIIIQSSGYGLIENCDMYNDKRSIDFANAWNCIVKDCRAYGGRFTTHGLFSTYIVFKDCSAFSQDNETLQYYAFTIGNGSYMFDEHIDIIDCKVFGGRTAVFALAKSKYVNIKNLYVENAIVAITLGDVKHINIDDSSSINTRTACHIEDSEDIRINGYKITGQTTSSQGVISVVGASKNIILENIDTEVSREVELEFNSSVDNAGIKIMNSNFRNSSVTARYLQVGTASGIEFYNIDTNKEVRIFTPKYYFLIGSRVPSWVVSSGLALTHNIILKGNILTGSNGTQPATPVEDESKSIYIQDNIYL